MYEQFEPTERIFVDREEYLQWMDDAQKRCGNQSVVMNLRGIGGIGKTSLLDYWSRTLQNTIRLNCDQYTDFYSRLNIISKRASQLGVKLSRFDVLWNIRQRFVEGVEPVKEKGQDAIREIMSLIPFVGTLASIGTALSVVSDKVKPRIRTKFGEVGSWLETRLGSDYVERLLEILWNEPRHAEFLYLDALLEDLNHRSDLETPVVVLLDHSELLDREQTRWRYSGRDITETELWYVFLSSISNSVGVLASRKGALLSTASDIKIEESELSELEKESCIDLLTQQGISVDDLQERIFSVSGGNPFVINSICDLVKTEQQSVEDIEDLRSENLEGVRLKVWRRLFSQSGGLQDLINRACLVPYFNKAIMTVIAPSVNIDQWDRLIGLSFVRQRDNGAFVFHDLAKELTISELGARVGSLSKEVSQLLEDAFTQTEDYSLLGFAVSVQGYISEKAALGRVKGLPFELCITGKVPECSTFLESLQFESELGEAVVLHMKGWYLSNMLGRIADGEHMLEESLEILRQIGEENPQLLGYAGDVLASMGYYNGVTTHRLAEGERAYREAIEIYQGLDEKTRNEHFGEYVSSHAELAWLLGDNQRFREQMEFSHAGIKLMDESTFTEIAMTPRGMLATAFCYLSLSRAHFRMGELTEAANILEKLREQFAPIIAMKRLAVNILGEVYLHMGKTEEAEAMHWEIEPIQRELFETGAMLEVAWFLKVENGLVQLMEINGKQAEADALIPLALNHGRDMIKNSPDYWDILLTWAIHNYARYLTREGKTAEVEAAYSEILDIWRKHAIGTPDFGNPMVGHTLNNLALLYSHSDRPKEAENAYQEAMAVLKDVTKRNPEAIFLADLNAAIRNNYSILLVNLEKQGEAEKMLIESLEIRDQYYNKCEAIISPGLGKTLNNLRTLLIGADRLDEAKVIDERLTSLDMKVTQASDAKFEEEELIHPWFR
jgi:tetratricopeptide (TPR) repeat protein